MLKKLITCLAAAASFQAHACNVDFSTSDNRVSAAVKKNGWNFSNYNIICEKLNRANAKIYISAHATVLSGKSIAWASTGLEDKDLAILTDEYGGVSTQSNNNASMDTANKMLIDAITDAVNNTDIDKALRALNEKRAQVKAAYSR